MLEQLGDVSVLDSFWDGVVLPDGYEMLFAEAKAEFAKGCWFADIKTDVAMDTDFLLHDHNCQEITGIMQDGEVSSLVHSDYSYNEGLASGAGSMFIWEMPHFIPVHSIQIRDGFSSVSIECTPLDDVSDCFMQWCVVQGSGGAYEALADGLSEKHGYVVYGGLVNWLNDNELRWMSIARGEIHPMDLNSGLMHCHIRQLVQSRETIDV